MVLTRAAGRRWARTPRRGKFVSLPGASLRCAHTKPNDAGPWKNPEAVELPSRSPGGWCREWAGVQAERVQGPGRARPRSSAYNRVTAWERWEDLNSDLAGFPKERGHFKHLKQWRGGPGNRPHSAASLGGRGAALWPHMAARREGSAGGRRGVPTAAGSQHRLRTRSQAFGERRR